MICDKCIRNLIATYSTGEKETHCIYGVMLCSDLINCSHFKAKPKPVMTIQERAKAMDLLKEGKNPRKGSQRTKEYKASKKKVHDV